MSDAGDFKYVDFATRALYRFRNNIVHVGDLGKLAERYGHTDCFCTYFLFDRGISDYVRDNHDSVAGYQGPCYANFIPLDIDALDLDQSLQTTREITRYLLDHLGVPEEAITTYYSGMKGFHLNITTGAFGNVEPGTELPRIFREVRRSIVNEVGVKHPETADFSISDRLRLLRLPNTKHTKSGLYKVPLDIEELFSYEHGEITNIAQKQREPWLTDKSGLVPHKRIEPVSNAVEMYKLCTEKADKELHKGLPDPGTFLTRGDIERMFCHAELELYESSQGRS
ncbi:hypothetical protein AMJ80_04870 [bacterium SM23_31]|nr:MAG: hypothetical protein AMJ80_04870 [bacterium SM23_31]